MMIGRDDYWAGEHESCEMADYHRRYRDLAWGIIDARRPDLPALISTTYIWE